MATPNKERQEHWQTIIEAQGASGLTQSRFCTQQGINVHNFHYWKRRLADPAPRLHDTDLIELPCFEIKPTFPALEFETEGILIPLAGGNACLTITGKLTVSDLARLLDACAPKGAPHVPA
jgi:hypothetical protein